MRRKGFFSISLPPCGKKHFSLQFLFLYVGREFFFFNYPSRMWEGKRLSSHFPSQQSLCLNLTNYIKNHIFFSIIVDLLQSLKTPLLKQTFIFDFKRQQYINKMRILSTEQKIESFKELQKILNKSFMLYHFHFQNEL